jgi:hypothetical protein
MCDQQFKDSHLRFSKKEVKNCFLKISILTDSILMFANITSKLAVTLC